MRRRAIRCLFIVVTILILTGCSAGTRASITGTWIVDSSDVPDGFGQYVFTHIPISFWEDGTFSLVKNDGEVWTSGEYEYSKGNLIVRTITILSGTHSTYEYSYECKIKGKTMVLENNKGEITLTKQR